MDDWIAYLGEHDALSCFYGEKLRASLFTGFLTLSGFLFTVKTFVVVRLQQDIYADDDYQKWVLVVGKRYNPTLTVYGSLKRLGRLLFATLICASTTSIAQMTVGLIEQRWSTWLALGMAALSGVLFLRSMFIVRSVIRAWITYLEKKANDRFAETNATQPPASETP